jgi:hypothetical protein
MTADKQPALKPRPRTPKGNRPYALGDPHTERVLYMTLAIATEVSVLHDRLDTLERVATAKDKLSLEDLEDYVPSDDVKKERSEWRKSFLARMFRILEEDIDPETIEERTRKYEELVAELAS